VVRRCLSIDDDFREIRGKKRERETEVHFFFFLFLGSDSSSLVFAKSIEVLSSSSSIRYLTGLLQEKQEQPDARKTLLAFIQKNRFLTKGIECTSFL
jgi:hypothetical protein